MTHLAAMILRQKRWKALDQARQIAVGIANMRTAMRGVSLVSMTHAPGPFATARSTFDATAEEMRKTFQQMEASKLSPEEQGAVNTMRSALDQWVENFRDFAEMSAAGHPEEASPAP